MGAGARGESKAGKRGESRACNQGNGLAAERARAVLHFVNFPRASEAKEKLRVHSRHRAGSALRGRRKGNFPSWVLRQMGQEAGFRGNERGISVFGWGSETPEAERGSLSRSYLKAFGVGFA